MSTLFLEITPPEEAMLRRLLKNHEGALREGIARAENMNRPADKRTLIKLQREAMLGTCQGLLEKIGREG